MFEARIGVLRQVFRRRIPHGSRNISHGLVSLSFGKDQLGDLLTCAGVRECVSVGTHAAGGAVHHAGSAVVGEVVG